MLIKYALPSFLLQSGSHIFFLVLLFSRFIIIYYYYFFFGFAGLAIIIAVVYVMC